MRRIRRLEATRQHAAGELDQLAFEDGGIGGRVGREHRFAGRRQEGISHLDPGRARAQGGQRVDEALGRVAPRDNRRRILVLQRIGLVVHDEHAARLLGQHVDHAVHEQGAHGVAPGRELERERELLADPLRPGDPAAQLRREETAGEPGDASDLVRVDRRAMRHQRRLDVNDVRDVRPREVDPFQQLVDDRPAEQRRHARGLDLRLGLRHGGVDVEHELTVRRLAGCARHRVGTAQAGDALQVEPVPAALVALERGVAEARHRQRRRERDGVELPAGALASAVRGGRSRRGRSANLGRKELVDRSRRTQPAGDPHRIALERPDLLADAVVGQELRRAGRNRAPDPVDRRPERRRLRPAGGLDPTAQHQVLLRSRHRDVEDPALLFLAPLGLLALQVLPLERAVGLARKRSQPQAGAAVLGHLQPSAAVAPGRAAEVRYADHRELKSLRRVDGHHAHGRLARLALEGSLALARLEEPPLVEVVDEAADVAALGGLEPAGDPHQLSHVGEPPVAGRHLEHRDVVAGVDHDAVDQRLERQARAARPLARKALAERPQRIAIAGREAIDEPVRAVAAWEEALLERVPQPAAKPARPQAQAGDPAERHPGKRRRQDRYERQLV